MSNQGWCKANYHRNGKRRFGELENGFCAECQHNNPQNIREKIEEMLRQRSSLNTKISQLRKKLSQEKET